jgi:hypothetical protein
MLNNRRFETAISRINDILYQIYKKHKTGMELSAFDSECNFTYTVGCTATDCTCSAVLACNDRGGWAGHLERCLMPRFERVGDE